MPQDSGQIDAEWMRQAIRLAACGQGSVEPNPMVGCVLVSSSGEEIGRGFHEIYGGPHAEIVALDDARRRANAHLLKGCTAYVSLEPCCHHGKTPPCTAALIDAGVARVVIAMLDPFPQVRGKGVKLLEERGIDVTTGVEQPRARALNAPYLRRLEQQLPWLIAKWAMSLDGRIAARTGHSQWISCLQSRKFVHELRARIDGVLVGRGTAVSDDPMLNARDVPLKRTALRIVADSNLQTPVDSKLLKSAEEIPTLFLAGPDVDKKRVRQFESRNAEVFVSGCTEKNDRLRHFLRHLAVERGFTNLLVEGGSELLGSLFDQSLVNQAEIFIAPTIIGGEQAISPVGGFGVAKVDQQSNWRIAEYERKGRDIHLSCLRIDAQSEAE